VRSEQIDVVFLDVEMPGLTGVDAAALLRERADPPAVVFVTAHERYAVDAFAVEAFDYLLKPIDPERLARTLERLRERSSEGTAPVDRVAVVAGTGTELLEYDQIHFAQADGDYSRVHTYDRTYLCTASLGDLEERLPASRFARVHRSYLVNLGKVAGVRRAGPEHLKLQLADAGRTELDVARRQARVIRERLGL
jgi:two-component system, LytTR family, response regulator LytT